VWIAPDGSERRDRRITGEVDLEGFLRHWQTTRERG
jgi:thiol:disulfide interchange protein DsbD